MSSPAIIPTPAMAGISIMFELTPADECIRHTVTRH
jgi:hypothetical protein